ncbi:MAG: hypothetical protein ACOX05_01670 [Bacillota bacterium]
MTKITKILVLSLSFLLVVSLLAGCGDNNVTSSDNNMTKKTAALANIFDLSDVQKITVWKYGSEENEPVNYDPYFKAFEITNSADIDKMVEAVDFNSWEGAYGKSMGITEYYIQFDDKMLYLETWNGEQGPYLYGGISDGNAGIEKNGAAIPLKNPDDFAVTSSGPYIMPYGIYTTLQEMIEKYAPELLED